jgi:hypothetical protein
MFNEETKTKVNASTKKFKRFMYFYDGEYLHSFSI